MEQLLCYHPWVGLEISAQGTFMPCCKYAKSIAGNLNDYQNSTELAELKQDFLAGRKPEGCRRCWHDEEAGHTSKRQLDWENMFNKTPPKLDSLKSLVFSFGNSCNLACRTCGSHASTTWINEAENLKQHFPDLKIYQHKRFYQDKEFVDQIKALCTDELLQVEFSGGEPFLAGTDEHLDFLDHLINCGATATKLHYLTNVTQFPKQGFWDRWKKFNSVEIQLSIDGIGEHFNYTRWPANWNTVVENVKHYQDAQQSATNVSYTVSHVVSIFTVYYLPEFVKWCLQNKLNKPYLGILSNPHMYDIKALPASVKAAVREKLSKYKFTEIITHMDKQDLNKYFDLTVQYTKVLDQQRGQQFAETFPEFYQLLQEAGCQI